MTTFSPGGMPVSALVSDSTLWVQLDANLLDVARVLAEANVGIVVVGDPDEKVTAVVSERDVVRAIAEGSDPASTPVGAVAHTELAWCDAETPVAEVAEEMMERYVRHVLVERRGRLVGVVSVRDLLGAYVSEDAALED